MNGSDHRSRTADDVRTRLHGLVDAQCAAGAPSCVLRVDVPALRTTWEFAAGTVSRTDRRRAQPVSPFRTASITKMFTAVATAQLVEESVIGLDDPVADHLPTDVIDQLDALVVVDDHSYGRSVTVRDLLEHSGGLDDHAMSEAFRAAIGAAPGRRWTARALLDQARRSSPAPTPPDRQRFTYSDTGYVVIGLMIEHMRGMPLHDVLRRRIIDPAGLVGTWLEGYETPRCGPVLHATLGDVDLMVIHGSADWAAGGLVSTATDLGRFMRALLDGRLVDGATRDELLRHRPGRIDAHQGRHGLVGYGLGVETRRRAGRMLWGHVGIWGSFSYADAVTGTTFTGTVNHAGDAVHRLLHDAVVIVGDLA